MSALAEFAQEYMCEFIQDKDDIALRTLAREYHERTEAYDQTICRARDKHGFAMLQGSYEIASCNRYAYQVRRELTERSAALGLGRRNLGAAISNEARHFEADWVNGRYQDDPRFQPFSRPSPYSRAV